ncbi:hypothetical protein RHGRI_027190 [Rhododendron griersonianum]|uniref:Uncharacterized protein n=1 Tax=Rhododendron griersonianum TaxID=479676 RepID=A0AAV6IV90_9ERIC|nr:hypothetical protein RHGRI_027190 [Rhododendron griersonianum]
MAVVDVLPEGCIANVASLTSPQDACRLAVVGSTFKSAAESDAVWERFLPSHYRDIITRAVDFPNLTPSSSSFASKKQLYLWLSDHPLLIDQGTKIKKEEGDRVELDADKEVDEEIVKEVAIQVDDTKIVTDVGDQVVEDQNNCTLEVVDTNISELHNSKMDDCYKVALQVATVERVDDDIDKPKEEKSIEFITTTTVDEHSLEAIQLSTIGVHVPLEKDILMAGNNFLDTKSFSLEKSSGRICYMLAARNLAIVWGDTPSYWRWISIPESRFSEVAELINVCWLEIRGKINTSMLSPNTTYAAFFVFKSTAGAYGFEYQPAEVAVGVSGSESETQSVYLDPEGGQRLQYQIVPRNPVFRRSFSIGNRWRQRTTSVLNGDSCDRKYPKARGDGWMEIEMGEYFNKGGGGEDEELEMSVMEVERGDWKSGLIVQGIEIRPKVVDK